MSNIQDINSNVIRPNQPTRNRDDSIYRTRPSNPPGSQKNFRKILDKEPEGGSGEMAEIEEEEEHLPSLFDLSQKKGVANKMQPIKKPLSALVSQEPILSEDESHLPEGSGLAVGKKRYEIPTQPPSADGDDMVAVAEQTTILKKEILKKKSDPTNELSGSMILQDKKEKDQVSSSTGLGTAVDPRAILAGGVVAQQILADNKGDSHQDGMGSHTFTMHQVISKVVEAIQVIEKSGLTETVVSLRYPPILEGATLTLSTNGDANKAFGIAFSSLTEAGKAFLDMRVTKDSLTHALEQQGFVVNSLTTTTLKEITINADPTPWDQKKERDPDGQEGRSRQQQEREDKNPNK